MTTTTATATNEATITTRTRTLGVAVGYFGPGTAHADSDVVDFVGTPRQVEDYVASQPNRNRSYTYFLGDRKITHVWGSVVVGEKWDAMWEEMMPVYEAGWEDARSTSRLGYDEVKNAPVRVLLASE